VHVVFLSTSVGALGSGIGGGVELTMRTLADGLVARGHSVTVVAPRGSQLGSHRVVQVDGALHVPSQMLDRSTPPVVPADSVLANMWREACRLAGDVDGADRVDGSGRVDVVLNFAYDALPFDASGECAVAVAHLVSMGSLSDEMDRAVVGAARDEPGCIAMHSTAQAATFAGLPTASVEIVMGGVDMSAYDFVEHADDELAFVGRISAEKGIDDVFAVAQRSGRRVIAFGLMQDESAWRAAAQRFPSAHVEHAGFLATAELQALLGRCAALVMVHHWVEAFGNVAVEALACGVPVITYDRGGPAEIVRDGVTGYVVPADDIVAVVDAVSRLPAIDRRRCRADAQERFSQEAFALRVERWLQRVVATPH
jgi:UDP-glucose:tetrahydrobiopterin glucosyltransferase